MEMTPRSRSYRGCMICMTMYDIWAFHERNGEKMRTGGYCGCQSPWSILVTVFRSPLTQLVVMMRIAKRYSWNLRKTSLCCDMTWIRASKDQQTLGLWVLSFLIHRHLWPMCATTTVCQHTRTFITWANHVSIIHTQVLKPWAYLYVHTYTQYYLVI